jgi:hypothetical protein
MQFRTWRDVNWVPPMGIAKINESMTGRKPWFTPPVQSFDPEYALEFIPDPSAPLFFYETCYGQDDPYFTYSSEQEHAAAQGTCPRLCFRSFRAPIWALSLTFDECIAQAKETDSRDKCEVFLRQALMLDQRNSEIRRLVSAVCQCAPGLIEDLYPPTGIRREFAVLNDSVNQAEIAMILDGYDNADTMFQYAFSCMQANHEMEAFEYSARTLCIDRNHEGAKWLLEVSKHRPRQN